MRRVDTIAEHDRDVAQRALALVLPAWGREKHRAEQLDEQLRLANGALRLLRALLQEDEGSASHEAAIIAHLDLQVAEQADEIKRLRRPWWKRNAS